MKTKRSIPMHSISTAELSRSFPNTDIIWQFLDQNPNGNQLCDRVTEVLYDASQKAKLKPNGFGNKK